MSTDRTIVLVIRIEDEERAYGGNDLMIGRTLIAHRKYDGSWKDDIQQEVEDVFADLLRERLVQNQAWTAERPEEEL